MKKILVIIAFSIAHYSGLCQALLTPDIYAMSGDKISIFNQSLCRSDSFCPLDYIDNFGDLTFTPNGKLYAIGQSKVAEIDTITGAVTVLCEIPFNNHPSLTYLSDSILLTDAKDSLWALNLNTCSFTSLGKIGYDPYYIFSEDGDTLLIWTSVQSDGDLVWSGGKLYTVAQERLFRITLNATATAIESSVIVNDYSIKIPPSYGLATINGQEGEEILAIGYDYLASYIINPVSGTFDTFCYYTDFSGPAIGGLTNRYLPITDTTVDSASAINELHNKEDIVIFPNPSLNGEISVRLKDVKLNDVTVSLYDIYGRKIKADMTAIDQTQILLKLPSSYSPGIYIIEIFTGKGVLRRRLALI